MSSHRVVAGLLKVDDSVLFCHRANDRAWFPGVWDLPGGHVEPDESPPQALVRELREELGVRVQGSPAHVARFVTPEFDLEVLHVPGWIGTPHNAAPAEHDAIGFFTPDQIADLEVADWRYHAMIRRYLRERQDDAARR